MTNQRSYYYHLINDNEMTDVNFGMPKRSRRCIWILLTTFILFAVLFLIIFIIFPVIFMNSQALQTNLIFTHFNLPNDKLFFRTQHLPAYQNRYITVNHTKDGENVTLGVWHILPFTLAYKKLYGQHIDFDDSLLNSNYSVLIYFHGTGEARSDNIRKYQLFSNFFHIIAFDYRDYADSSQAQLTEKTVVNDCVELYKWVRNRTNSDIYIWGHSLGAAIATETVAILENMHNIKGKGLILESAFTNLHDELYEHPIVKMFAWLPWFKVTVVNPLTKSGFEFDTEKHISKIKCPMMILHAQDDNEIPCKFGRKLYQVAFQRSEPAIYYEFDAAQECGHIFIYTDPYLKFYILNFLHTVSNYTNN